MQDFNSFLQSKWLTSSWTHYLEIIYKKKADQKTFSIEDTWLSTSQLETHFATEIVSLQKRAFHDFHKQRHEKPSLKMVFTKITSRLEE